MPRATPPTGPSTVTDYHKMPGLDGQIVSPGQVACARVKDCLANPTAAFAGVSSLEGARRFVEETTRTFLSHHTDGAGAARYALRHQSLRSFICGGVPPGRPDAAGLARSLASQVQAAHAAITTVLIPPGASGERAWGSTGPYERNHLAAHAAAAGELDALVCDPGFLLTASPFSILAERDRLSTVDGTRAVTAFAAMSSNPGPALPHARRLDQLAATAACVHAAVLTQACARAAEGNWPIRWAAWRGQQLQKLTSHNGPVTSVAIGRAGDRDIIVTGSADRTVRIWDAVTGAPLGEPLTDYDGGFRSVAVGTVHDRRDVYDKSTVSVAIGRAGNRDIIVTGSIDNTRIWDAATGAPLWESPIDNNSSVRSVVVGFAGNRDIIITGSPAGKARIWDAVTGAPLGGPLARHDGYDDSVARPSGVPGTATSSSPVLPRGRRGSGSGSGTQSPALRSANPSPATAATVASVASVAVGRAGNRDIIITNSRGRTALIWDAVTRAPVGEPLTSDNDRMASVAVSRAGGRDIIITGSGDSTARIWDAVTGAQSANLSSATTDR